MGDKTLKLLFLHTPGNVTPMKYIVALWLATLATCFAFVKLAPWGQ